MAAMQPPSIHRDAIETIDLLEDLLSEPTAGAIDTLGRLEGDVIVLGVGGKMGPTLARMARRAIFPSGRGSRSIRPIGAT